MKNFTLTLIIFMGLFAVANPPASTTTRSTEIFFETGSYELSEEMCKMLDKWLLQIPKNTDYQIKLSGHTDNIGGKNYNRTLSENRALSVRNYLESKGYDPELIVFDFYGKERPALPNTSEENRSANRRVTLEITTFYFRTLEELREVVARNTQNIFTVQNAHGGMFTCTNGTQLLIPPYAFLDADGKPAAGKVSLEVTEAVKLADMLANQLGTLSGEKMLVTGGMLKLKATDKDGHSLTIAKDNEILANIPTENFNNGMTVFLSEDGNFWSNTERPVVRGMRSSRAYYIQRKMYFMLQPLPEYEPSDLEMPQVPRKPTEPYKPKKPNIESYVPKDAWYGFIGRKKREREAKERFERALDNYERNLATYHARYEKYYEEDVAYGKEILQYKAALKNYWKNRSQDSLAFIASAPYQNALKKNDSIRKSSNEIQKKLYEEWKTLQEKKADERMAQLEKEGGIESWQLESYTMSVTELDWINIDRFYDYPISERRQIVAKDPKPLESHVSIVFDNINSILPFKYQNGKGGFRSPQIPKKEVAKILAYKVMEGKIWLCIALVDEKEEYDLDYQQVSLKEFKNTLSQFNRLQGS